MATNSATSALRPLERGESCAYLLPDSVTGCRAPRSCRSCLETAGCMVDFAGGCVSQEVQAVNSALLYDRAIAAGLSLPNATASRAAVSAPQAWLFPAGAVSYCDASQDAVCRECTRTNFWRSKYAYPDSRFCVSGEESARCVCIDVCERPWIAKPDCSSQSALTPGAAPTRVVMVGGGPSNYSGTARAVFYAFLGVTFFVVITLGLMVRARLGAATSFREAQSEARRRRDQARRERRNVQLGVNPLSLTGWEAYRRELIDKETAQLASTGSGGKTLDESAASTAAASSASNSDGDDGHEGSCHRDESQAAYIRVVDDDTSANQATTPAANTTATSELAALTPARPLVLPPTASTQRRPPATH